MTGVPAHATGGHGHRPPAADHLKDPVTRQVRLWNVANALTMLRLVLVPGFVLLLLHGDGHDPAWRSFAWAAFAVAMITDLFDGELARRYDLVTDFGKIADPIADKAIMGAALIGLSALGDLPWWVTAVILFREVGITLMRFWVIRHAVIPASRGGKLKTLTQGVAVGMYVLILTGPLATLRAWFMAAAVVLTVLTGLDYVRQAVVLRRQSLASAPVPGSAALRSAGGAESAGGAAARSAGGAESAGGADPRSAEGAVGRSAEGAETAGPAGARSAEGAALRSAEGAESAGGAAPRSAGGAAPRSAEGAVGRSAEGVETAGPAGARSAEGAARRSAKGAESAGGAAPRSAGGAAARSAEGAETAGPAGARSAEGSALRSAEGAESAGGAGSGGCGERAGGAGRHGATASGALGAAAASDAGADSGAGRTASREPEE